MYTITHTNNKSSIHRGIMKKYVTYSITEENVKKVVEMSIKRLQASQDVKPGRYSPSTIINEAIELIWKQEQAMELMELKGRQE